MLDSLGFVFFSILRWAVFIFDYNFVLFFSSIKLLYTNISKKLDDCIWDIYMIATCIRWKQLYWNMQKWSGYNIGVRSLLICRTYRSTSTAYWGVRTIGALTSYHCVARMPMLGWKSRTESQMMWKRWAHLYVRGKLCYSEVLVNSGVILLAM
jgi:hypothetical protein